jgi:hypothetical protein
MLYFPQVKEMSIRQISHLLTPSIITLIQQEARHVHDLRYHPLAPRRRPDPPG